MSKGIFPALRNHWTVKRGRMVPKVQFESLDEALAFMERRHIDKDVFTPYVCKDCNKWHIGHTRSNKNH